MQTQTKIRAADLATFAQQISAHTKVLSLDCFDTLIWRHVAAPTDVFYDLQNQPEFKNLGINARLRIQTENLVRQLKLVQASTNEVTLFDIYRLGFPSLSVDLISHLMQKEIQQEKSICFAFQPTIELIKKAHTKGLKIILVSDTYFKETQLRDILAACLPAEVMKLIHKIYVSCDHQRSKSTGLFKTIINDLQINAHDILHLGDNIKADYEAALKQGLQARHLVQYNTELQENLRMQAVSACMLNPAIRNQHAYSNPLCGLLAMDTKSASTPEYTLGFATLGSIMFAFAQFLSSSIKPTLKEANTKIVFLMRDAYLPYLCCEVLNATPLGKQVRISRFAAFASSFRTQFDVDSYLADKINAKQYADMCRQLLLPDDVTENLLKKLENALNPSLDFLTFIHQEKILNLIFSASKTYFQRLVSYLKNEVNLQAGDKLVFVDLGYSGTAQTKLAPLFKQEMNVEISGLYLLSLDTADVTAQRDSLLNSTYFDDKSLTMLVNYIAVLEQLCTTSENSVIDFDIQGNPIYSDVAVSDYQNQKLKHLQAETLRFVAAAKNYVSEADMSQWRNVAAINLTRLIFFPTKAELDYLQHFEFDFNLGSKAILPVFDINKGITGLRRRSWLHSGKETMKNMRTNYPAEWRAASLELSLALMAQHRFGLEFALHDLSHRREQIQVLAILDGNWTPLMLEATPTYDGYYALLIPVVDANCHLAIKLGANYQWIELESAEFIKMNALYTRSEFEFSQNAEANLSVDQMNDKGGGLFECLSQDSALVFTPPSLLDNDRHILRLVFRPVVAREASEAAVA